VSMIENEIDPALLKASFTIAGGETILPKDRR
jgi:hypothetical protein